MSHQCQNLLVHCMDFRLQPAIYAWLQEKGWLGETDIVSVAGACQSFIAEPADCIADDRWNQLGLSSRLHHISRVIFVQHDDCGAYGGQTAFASYEAEIAKLENDLKKTKAICQEKYPQLEVLLLRMVKNKEGWEFKPVNT